VGARKAALRQFLDAHDIHVRNQLCQNLALMIADLETDARKAENRFNLALLDARVGKTQRITQFFTAPFSPSNHAENCTN
jgi:hypothetical protein